MATVLIADEDKLFVLTLSHVLSTHGHKVILVSKASQAITVVERGEVDVGLLDVILASKRDLFLLKAIRQADSDLPLILSVSKTIPEEIRKKLRQGLYDYINKPFGHEELISAVERAVERRRLNLENKALLNDLQERVKELSTLNIIAKTLNSTLKLKEVLDIIMNEIKELVKAEAWSILMIDEKTNELVFEVAMGEKGEQVKEIRLKIGQGVAGWVAQEGKPIVVQDVEKDQRFYKGVDEKTKFKTKSILAIPLISRGKIIGVVEIINKSGSQPFTEKDLELVQRLTEHAGVAIENARLYEKVERLAITDDLTGLYNSRYCDEFLEKSLEIAAREEAPLSVIFLDLDNLKEVDDTYGHLMGGETLREVGTRLKKLVKDPEIAARFGGDEFVLILPNQDVESALEKAEEVRKSIEAEPFLVGRGVSCRITASLGVASFPRHAKNQEVLLHKADQAMYKVKLSGKNRVGMAE
ncbi:MAG: diguanylate cyclase [Candidatus Edwardsbacteria bacterium]